MGCTGGWNCILYFEGFEGMQRFRVDRKKSQVLFFFSYCAVILVDGVSWQIHTVALRQLFLARGGPLRGVSLRSTVFAD